MKYSYDLQTLIDEMEDSDSYWVSFLKKENFELGVLNLDPGQKDVQHPHKSDEVYFIISGDGYLNIGGRDYSIRGKTAFFVPKNTPHYFHKNKRSIIGFYVLN